MVIPEPNVVNPIAPAAVPLAQKVDGVPDEGSRINQADELDARRRHTPDADANPASERDDHREPPESDGADGEPQTVPPEYRSFGDFQMTADGLFAPVGPQRMRTRICASFEVIGRARDPHERLGQAYPLDRRGQAAAHASRS
jgi:hypothetical protein